MTHPVAILMSPPDHFDVVDEKNPHMAGHVGTVDKARARAQWDELKATFAAIGLEVFVIPPVEGCEDMVFCANQTFVGPGRICLLGRMKHSSRRRELPAFAAWFKARGYTVVDSIPDGLYF